MDKFSKVTSVPAYLSIVNVDTDMMIPKQFLKTIKRTGLGKSLFFELRYDEDGKPLKVYVEAFEKSLIEDTMRKHKGSINKVMEELLRSAQNNKR